MKVKINLNKDESLEKAEERLEKALVKKKECTGTERYDDPALNEFQEWVCEEHSKVLDSIIEEVKTEIKRHVNSTGHYK